MTNINKLKANYNDLIQRHNKAAEYMDNNSIPLETRELYLLGYIKIVSTLNQLLNLLSKKNIEYTDYEVLNGFNI